MEDPTAFVDLLIAKRQNSLELSEPAMSNSPQEYEDGVKVYLLRVAPCASDDGWKVHIIPFDLNVMHIDDKLQFAWT
jgi:hypothetical protein